jgi:hypothetical protein
MRNLTRGADARARARAAYMAVCLDMADQARREHPAQWQAALSDLADHWRVVQNIYYMADTPGGLRLREKAAKAGVVKPARQKNVW